MTLCKDESLDTFSEYLYFFLILNIKKCNKVNNKLYKNVFWIY